ncbi:MAG: VTT domain-containing protein [Phycisphaerales bacterium]|nr:VTT domain-containing protein [Phycisphaerales bacterium]
MPEFLKNMYELGLHGWLEQIAHAHGPLVYAVLFAIVFAETGFVVTPFLPGDSLLFVVGMLSGSGVLRIYVAAPLLLAAAVLGNTTNYHIGKWLGPRVFRKDGKEGILGRALSRKHLERAHAFFERHGGKAVMLGQFVPLVRTFCPFIAGAGAMTYSKFIFFNVMGAVLWVGICCGAGYFLGGFPFVKDNFEFVMIAVVGVSLIPVLIEFLRSRWSRVGQASSTRPPAEGAGG